MPETDMAAFIRKWIFKNAWIMALVFIFFNTWFKAIFNIVIVLFFAAIFYGDWLTEQDKLAKHLFREEPLPAKKDGIYYWGFLSELAILLIGLHFLNKGFVTVTGMSEKIF